MSADDELPPFPSPVLPLGLHLLGATVHLLAGGVAVVTAIFGPQLHPILDAPATPTRYWLGGIAGFSTLVILFFSTVLALASLRLSAIFVPRTHPGRIRAAMFAGVLLAHLLGCGAGIVGSGVAVFGTVFGEHGGPWSERAP